MLRLHPLAPSAPCQPLPRAADATPRGLESAFRADHPPPPEALNPPFGQTTRHLQVIAEACTLTRAALDAGFMVRFGGGSDRLSRAAVSTGNSRSPTLGLPSSPSRFLIAPPDCGLVFRDVARVGAHPLLLRGPTVHPGAPLPLRPAAGFIRPTACSLPDSFFPRR